MNLPLKKSALNILPKLVKNPVLIVVLTIMVVATLHLIDRLSYEAGGVYTWDTPLYMAVGQGMANGLEPYSDLFETKPPGIYILGMLGSLLGNQLLILNFFQILVLAGIPLLFLFYWFRHIQPRSQLPLEQNMAQFFVFFSACILFTLYMAERAGEIQIESFGGFFSLLYAVSLLHFKDRTFSVFSLPHAILSGALLLSVGFKEPFILVNLGIALLVLDSRREFLKTFLYPLLSAILIGGLVLAISGILTDYVEYFLYMSRNWSGRHGSLLSRVLDPGRIPSDAKAYAPLFDWLIILIGLSWLVSKFRASNQNQHTVLFLSFRLLLAVLLVTMAVALGGEYFNHHFGFAIPFLLTLLFLAAREMTRHAFQTLFQSILASAIAITTVVSILGGAQPEYEKRTRFLDSHRKIVINEAKYIDAVLDRVGVSRWLFIGSNGPQAYGFTKHSPYGPFFCQYNNWPPKLLALQNSSILSNLKTARLVVFDADHLQPHIMREVQKVLATDFTQDPWPSVSTIPRPSKKYKIWFRKNI